MSRLFLALPAPAKLNLFLHVVGQRADGYHDLQSVFVPVDLADLLDVERRDDGRIERTGDVVGDVASDLAVRAGLSLQQASGTRFGATIHVEKRIPAGSGMGGGSSDAATALIALNRLWDLAWPRERLSELAVSLGADVPFFLGAGPAFVEGIGERLTPLALAPRHYAVVHPQVAVSTREIFADPGLTRDTKATIIAAFSAAQDEPSERLFGANDLEVVVRRRHRSWIAQSGIAAFRAGAHDRIRFGGVHAGNGFESRGGGNRESAGRLAGVGRPRLGGTSAGGVVAAAQRQEWPVARAPANTRRQGFRWGVAKLVKAPDFDSGIRRFESFLPSHSRCRRAAARRAVAR